MQGTQVGLGYQMIILYGIAGSDKYGAVICQYTHQINDVLVKWSAAGNQTGAVTPPTTPPSVEPTTQPPVTNPPTTSQPTTEPKTTDNVVFSFFNWLASLFGF